MESQDLLGCEPQLITRQLALPVAGPVEKGEMLVSEQDIGSKADIIYTKVDEAPELASASFLPIIRKFTAAAGISVGTMDISLAGRIIANFSENLTDDQRQPDHLAELGEMVNKPETNVIKLPNISASVPQLNAAIKELQEAGYDIPSYPDNPQNDKEKSIKATYGIVLGSAVNPILRQGNSDRRAPNAVKEYAKANPHRMGAWTKQSKTHVATMGKGDFRSNEKSTTVSVRDVGPARIQYLDGSGATTLLKDDLSLTEGEVIDATKMSVTLLRSFLEEQIAEAKDQGILFSLHLKATMMKVADPIIFGHTVSVFFMEVFQKHAAVFSELDIDPNFGLVDLYAKIQSLPEKKRSEIEEDIEVCLRAGPELYMVNSDRGISNLHVSSDTIIDASMPALIRGGGKGWGPDGKEADCKCVIPDSSYAAVYAETINFCKEHGAFDPSQMGTVSNVGLMADKAEEYGSHPQTYTAPGTGIIRVVGASGLTLLEHEVDEGDIWRMCMTKDAPIRDWVKLGVSRARATGVPAVFWLNHERAHDAELIVKVEEYLKEHETSGLELHTMAPAEATRYSLERMKKGQDTVSVTGNVLRDYLTDLFPILEVGTSAKMLSIVPLMNGGGLFETGAGGSAPKHVQQMIEEGHLRWDSLGEFCALGASLELLSDQRGNAKAAVLASGLDKAIGKLLDERKSPSRKVGELDNRGSHFYLALYWAESLATQDTDMEMQNYFKPIASALANKEVQILRELNGAQGEPVELGGYYHAPQTMVSAAMRPSSTLNSIIG